MSDFEIQADGKLAVLTMKRAYCLDIAGKHALTAAIKELASDDQLRTLILTHTHPAAFLVDVAELADMRPDEAEQFSASGHALAAAIESAPFPVIAAVEGSALGGGCELVLACDLAIAGAKAQFGQIEAMGGVMPAFGGTWRLPRRVGLSKALEMMFTGAIIDAATAKSLGLVLDVAEDSAIDHAKALATRIAATSRASLAAIKQAVVYAYNRDPREIDTHEQRQFAALFGPEQSRRMHDFLSQQVSQ